jgi:hypothetical protein
MRPRPFVILNLRVGVLAVQPPVWRQVALPSDLALAQLHEVIQVVMGWSDRRPHRFKRRRGPHTPGSEHPNEETTTLRQVFTNRGARVYYHYGDGDGWRLRVVSTWISLPHGRPAPRVAQYKRASPPEDIGGNRRYMELLEAIRDPHHPGRGELVAQYRGFDPLRYDVEATNDALAALRLPPPVTTAVH